MYARSSSGKWEDETRKGYRRIRAGSGFGSKPELGSYTPKPRIAELYILTGCLCIDVLYFDSEALVSELRTSAMIT